LFEEEWCSDEFCISVWLYEVSIFLFELLSRNGAEWQENKSDIKVILRKVFI
jgi:hypothetical protein